MHDSVTPLQPPKAFISYSWDDEAHKSWVHALASRLRTQDGVDVTLDYWELVAGDQLPEFMERAVRDNDFVLIVCTPKYKDKSDKRIGGVGYEGDIMTGELLTKRNHRKFIPVLRSGERDAATPTWLGGKYGITLTGDPYSEDQYRDLVATLHNLKSKAPPVGKGPSFATVSEEFEVSQLPDDGDEDEIFVPVKIEGVIVDEVGEPLNNGTRGSALYAVPFKLSYQPPLEWRHSFLNAWNSPPEYTLRHRPGIAEIHRDRLTLKGTTMEEIQEVHRKTLKLAVDVANAAMAESVRRGNKEYRRRQEEKRKHQANVRKIADDLKFD